jgi:hypothetical protein
VPSRRPARRPRTPALVVGAVVLGLVASGCSSDGEGDSDGGDPTTTVAGPGGASGTPVGNDAVDAVLTLLEGPATTEPYTATYALVLRLGDVASTGTVAADGSGARSVTIGDVRFVVDSDGDARTCRVSTGECEDGLLDARTSDLGFGSGVAADVPARRLRVAWSRRSGDPTAGTETIAGQPATCVTVPVGEGAESYCALDAGVLARWTAADVVVDLESFTAGAAPELFTP